MSKLFKATLVVALVIGASVGVSRAFVHDNKTDEVIHGSITIKPPETINKDDLFVLVNSERTKASLTALSSNPQLDISAKAKCDEMVSDNYYAHKNPVTGKSGTDFIKDQRIRGAIYYSENLNDGFVTRNSEFVDSWMNSPSHRAAILDPKYSQVGYAVCKSIQYGYIAVQHMVQIDTQITQQNSSSASKYDYTQNVYTTPKTTTCTSSDYSVLGRTTTTCKSY